MAKSAPRQDNSLPKAGTPNGPEQEPWVILVVDDDPRLLSLVEQILESGLSGSPCRVVCAKDGYAGLEAARQAEPDIVVSDIMMPGMSGLDFCKAFRAMNGFRDTPFLFLSALGTARDRVTGLRSGADDYLPKPFDPDELVARLESLTRKLSRRPREEALGGYLEEVSLMDILQFLDYTMREGILHIRTKDADGKLTVRSPMLMDAVFRDITGEDALMEMLALREGHFRFSPGAVPEGAIAKPISFMLMDTIRLYDERQDSQEFVPADIQPLKLNSVPDGQDDPDTTAVIRAIRKGKVNLPEIQETTRLSQSRVAVTVAKLVRKGHIEPQVGNDILQLPVRPVRLLVACVREEDCRVVLQTLAGACGLEAPRGATMGGMSFLKLAWSDRVFHLFSIRGDKRFSFLWDRMLGTTDATIFAVAGPEDERHLEDFRTHVSSLDIPLFVLATGATTTIPAERMEGAPQAGALLTRILNTIDKVEV